MIKSPFLSVAALRRQSTRRSARRSGEGLQWLLVGGERAWWWRVGVDEEGARVSLCGTQAIVLHEVTGRSGPKINKETAARVAPGLHFLLSSS